MREACEKGDKSAVTKLMLASAGGVNGPDPLDYVAERPIHDVLSWIYRCPTDELFQDVLRAALSVPGIVLLGIRNNDGFLAQTICKRGWGAKRICLALQELALARGVNVKELLGEIAKIGGQDTKSCFYRALMSCIQSRSTDLVRELLLLGAEAGAKEISLLSDEPDKDDEIATIALRGSKQIRAQLLRIVSC